MYSVVLLAVTLSFCSLMYELLLAKSFMLITDNVVLAQTLSVGLYLLGIGIGVLFQRKHEKKDEHFFKVEVILSILGLSIPLYAYGMNSLVEIFLTTYVSNIFIAKLSFFSGMALVVGYFTGQEFMFLVARASKYKLNLNLVLAATYFGNLIGGLAFPLVLYEPLGLIGTCVLIASLNIGVAFFLAWRRWSVVNSASLIVASLLLFMMSLNHQELSLKLKSLSYTSVAMPDFKVADIKNLWFFFKKEAPRVESFRSKYQDIDLVTYSSDETVLFLNRKPQFSTQNYRSYHMSMLEGFINLNGGLPKTVLILGGGDGILARYLLEKGVNKIKIIDLDPFMTYLAKSHQAFLSLNRGSLLSEKVEVINGDAFSFMMKNQVKYEAIFIDFPLPTHLDLSKLYSAEFYKQVYKGLSDTGSAIFDSPASLAFRFGADDLQSPSLNLISKTLESAGIQNHFSFGPHEAFGFFTRKSKKVVFDYEEFPESMEGFVLMNMVELKSFINIEPSLHENSIFRQRRFR